MSWFEPKKWAQARLVGFLGGSRAWWVRGQRIDELDEEEHEKLVREREERENKWVNDQSNRGDGSYPKKMTNFNAKGQKRVNAKQQKYNSLIKETKIATYIKKIKSIVGIYII